MFYLHTGNGPIYRPATCVFLLVLTGFSPQGAESLASIWEYWDRDSQSEGEAAVVEDGLHPDHIVV